MFRFFNNAIDSVKKTCNDFFHPNDFPEFIINDTISALKTTASNSIDDSKRIKTGLERLHVGHLLNTASCTLLMAGADSLHKLKLQATPEKKHTYTIRTLGTLALMLANEDLKLKKTEPLYPITYDELQKEYNYVPAVKKLDFTRKSCPTKIYFIENVGTAIYSGKLPRPNLDKDMFPLLTGILSSHLRSEPKALEQAGSWIKTKLS